MPLTDEQRAMLAAEAKRRGIDPDRLIAAAEASAGARTTSGRSGDSSPQPESDKPKLFMYLLPFVTVREVRSNWLGLSEPFSGDSEIASKWAAEQSGTTSDASADQADPQNQ